jgi:amino acid permease
MFIGIALVAFPFSVSWVGFLAATFGILVLATISLSSSYLLFKARNRLKSQNIVDLTDLGYACFGEKMKIFCQIILLVTQCSILTAYFIYLGG